MANLPSRQLQLFPNCIDRFLQVPRWYKHQYEDRTKVDGDVRPLLRGIALHEVLAGDARPFQQGQPFRDDVRVACKACATGREDRTRSSPDGVRHRPGSAGGQVGGNGSGRSPQPARSS